MTELVWIIPKRWTAVPGFGHYGHSEQPCCKHLYTSSPPTLLGIISLEMDFLKWVYWVKGLNEQLYSSLYIFSD